MHTAAGGGDSFCGVAAALIQIRRERCKLGTSRQCQELGKPPSRSRAHLSPRVPSVPEHALNRAWALRLVGATYSFPVSPVMWLTPSSQNSSGHILGRETLPKRGWNYLLPAERDGAGMATVLGSGTHRRCQGLVESHPTKLHLPPTLVRSV